MGNLYDRSSTIQNTCSSKILNSILHQRENLRDGFIFRIKWKVPFLSVFLLQETYRGPILWVVFLLGNTKNGTGTVGHFELPLSLSRYPGSVIAPNRVREQLERGSSIGLVAMESTRLSAFTLDDATCCRQRDTWAGPWEWKSNINMVKQVPRPSQDMPFS